MCVCVCVWGGGGGYKRILLPPPPFSSQEKSIVVDPKVKGTAFHTQLAYKATILVAPALT